MACVAVCAACGSTQGGNAPGSSGSSSTPAPNAVNLAPFPAAVLKACKGVDVTTPLAKVPAACQSLWTPYGVSEVPPMNLFDHIPALAPATNGTNGAVSNSELHTWELAFYRDQALFQWAERYSQVGFFNKIEAPSVLSQSEATTLGSGSYIEDPQCDIFPTSISLVRVSKSDASFLEVISGSTTTSTYALNAKFDPPSSGSCAGNVVDKSGKSSVYFTFSNPEIEIEAGAVQSDPVLGKVWFPTAATTCAAASQSSLATPPSGWCS